MAIATTHLPKQRPKTRSAMSPVARLVSRSQTAIFSFILGREKIGSGTPPIEKAVLASTAIGVGDYWQWLLCNR